MLSIVDYCDLELEQLVVKTSFQHGYLDEIIEMRQPKCFVDRRKSEHICLLKKNYMA